MKFIFHFINIYKIINMNHNQKEVKVTLKKAELLRSTKLCSKMVIMQQNIQSPYVEIITKN